MRFKSPREYGLPEKFSQWRTGQESGLAFLQQSPKRVKAVCAPTGWGKTSVYVADSLNKKLPTCVVTSSRGLQDQLMQDFAPIGMVDLRGKRNYSCSMREDYTCEEGHAGGCPYKGSVACDASQAEMRAATSTLVTTNYRKWTSSRRYGTGMAHFQRVVFDEGHECPEALAQEMQVILNHKEIEEKLEVPFPVGSYADDMQEWRTWAQAAKVIADAALIEARAKMEHTKDLKPAWVRNFTHLRNLTRRLAVLATAQPSDWIVEESEFGYQFDPIRPGRYAEGALLLKMPDIIVISATLRPKTLHMMGVGKVNYDFIEFDSDFDPKRCPIYYVPTMRVDARAEDLSPLWVRINQIAAKRRDRKGIIQTVSFTRQADVLANCRFSESMLFNPKGEAPTQMIEQFRQAAPGAILVSPSVTTGYDFRRRDCEWQFLCKVPFAPPSKILKAREADDPEYRSYAAMNLMVQIFGRAMRDKDDQCENFISDDHMEWFKPRYGHLAPRSFHGFYRTVRTLPQPPERLAA